MSRYNTGRREEAAAGRSTTGAGRCARGFTLIDLMIAIFALLVIAAIAMPSMRPDDRSRLLGAGGRVLADLQYARSMSIGQPDNPGTLVLREEGDGYWLALTESPETPIEKNGLGDPYEIVFGVGDAATLSGVSVALVGSKTPGGAIAFDAFGRLNPAVAAELILTNPAGSLAVVVDPWTGDAELQAIIPPE